LTEKPELVEVVVKVPKPVIEFYKALFAFEKTEKSLPEYLGLELCRELEGHFDDDLLSILSLEELLKNYGLNQVFSKGVGGEKIE
jgi:hypothetical protein